MAEESDQGEKTEEPTERRLQKAREEGQFLRSQDTSIAVLLISVAVVLYFYGASAGEAFVRLFNSALRFDSTLITSPGIVIGILSDLFVRSLAIISPLLAMTVLLTIITAYLTGGIGFSVKAFLPKASKLNPISGLGRMFGARSLIELTKSLAKLLLISSTIIGIVYFVNDQLFSLTCCRQSPPFTQD